jgi:hypothetical protein
VIAIRANDAAANALGFAFDHDDADVEPLATRIRTAGLARDDAGGLYVPRVSFDASGKAPDLTGREVERNTWHLEDHPDVYVELDADNAPHIGAKDQVLMLKQGIALARVIRELAEEQAEDLSGQPPICCITAVNETNGTFRFHQLRDGENWLDDNLSAYPNELIIAIESRPASAEA